MTSISRSGEPTWSTVTSSSDAPPWSKSVKWQKADILKPETYKPVLNGADAVVHSMGILLEADYKGVITGKESILGGLSRAFSATKGGSQNPLERKEGEALRPQEKDGQLTYELMNRDSGETIPSKRPCSCADPRLLSSNHPCTRSIPPRSTLLRLHLRRSRSTHASQTVYYHKARCRVHDSFRIT